MSKGSTLEEVNTAYVGPYLPGRVPQHHVRNAFSKAAFDFCACRRRSRRREHAILRGNLASVVVWDKTRFVGRCLMHDITCRTCRRRCAPLRPFRSLTREARNHRSLLSAYQSHVVPPKKSGRSKQKFSSKHRSSTRHLPEVGFLAVKSMNSWWTHRSVTFALNGLVYRHQIGPKEV